MQNKSGRARALRSFGMKILQWQRRLMESEKASGLPEEDTILSQFTGGLAPFRFY